MEAGGSNPLTPTSLFCIEPIDLNGWWAFLFLARSFHCLVDAPALTLLIYHLFSRWCSKVFGQLLGLGLVWARAWCQRKEN